MANPVAERAPWWRRQAADLRLTTWAKGLAALGLAGTALFGGLDRVDTGVTTVQPGESYDDGALTVNVQRASLVSSLRSGDRVLREADNGTRYLAVVADIANAADTDVPLTDELDLRDIPDARKIGVFRLADGTQTARIGPGLNDTFGFVWQVPELALNAGETVSVRIWQKEYQELAVTFGKAWIDSLTDYGQVDVPVAVK